MARVKVGRYELNYVEAGDGYPLLLIHGLAGDHQAWTAQLESWSTRFRVIATDSRGAGQSTQVDEPVSTRDLAEDMLALMDQLGVPRAHVVGRSMGGAIAQHMALMAPDRVQSLALCASFAKIDPLGERVLTNMREVLEWTGRWEDHGRHSVQNFVSGAFYNANPDIVANLLRIIGSESRLPACYIRQNHACLEHDTRDQLARIGCPTLVMGGGQDPICSPLATRWLSEGIPGAETVMFDNSSHFFLMEESERFMDIVGDWLVRNTPA
jgi:3-oxoadipate enol-lactonase